MSRDTLVQALGTLHCPYCQMPLFANRVEPAGDAPPLAARFVEPHILIAEDAFPQAASLVDLAERLDLWQPAAVAGEAGAGYGANRTNDVLLVTGQLDPALAPFEEALRGAFHAAARAYAGALGHLPLRSDLGYQLLRYRPGQHFGEHVDAMPGATAYGQRLVSAILYLNDGFEGGELSLPRQGLSYNPRAGSLMLFPSNFCYPHASLPVRAGVKYSAVTWFV